MNQSDRESKKTPNSSTSGKDPGDPPRVLIIDDEPMIAKILARLIGKENEVHISQNGVEARERFHSGERYDVIMCDIMMPEVSGMDLYADLQKNAPDQAQRMIFMTGGAFTEATRAFLDSIPNPRVDKPFDVGRVKEALGNILRGA